MKQKLENWDPFGLAPKPRFKSLVMLMLYIAIGAVAISVLLYIVLAIFSDRNAKLSQYGRKVREWRKRTEFKSMDGLSVAAKIMPSENTKGNMIVLSPHNEDLLTEAKLARSYNYTQSYFYHANTTLYFPVFHYLRENVPVGDSELDCAHAFWTARENEMTLELYESFKGFPKCSRADNPRVIWPDHDPTQGVEFYTWTQKAEPLSGCSTQETCQKQCDKRQGIAKKTREQGHYVCYSYLVLTDICLMVDYNGTDSWSYVGGCFDHRSPVRMATAEPGKSYFFDSIRIQIRSVHDPFIVATHQNSDSDDLSFGTDIDFLYSIAFFILFIAILCGVLVAAAVILKEYIYRTHFFEQFFQESPPLSGHPQ
jgi:hypothetical protein